MLNGVTLANGGDYYQSISKDNRRWFINWGYNNNRLLSYYNGHYGLITSNPIVSWQIANPELVNGIFILEVSNNMFSSFIYTGVTNYVIGH
jgi:hypothetical protein